MGSRVQYDLIGQVFGLWHVVSRAEKGHDGKARWLCQCISEGESVPHETRMVLQSNLLGQKSRGCGCAARAAMRVAYRKEMCSDAHLKYLYEEECLSSVEIAVKFGVTPRTVQNRLRAAGVTIRSMIHAKKIYAAKNQKTMLAMMKRARQFSSKQQSIENLSHVSTKIRARNGKKNIRLAIKASVKARIERGTIEVSCAFCGKIFRKAKSLCERQKRNFCCNRHYKMSKENPRASCNVSNALEQPAWLIEQLEKSPLLRECVENRP